MASHCLQRFIQVLSKPHSTFAATTVCLKLSPCCVITICRGKSRNRDYTRYGELLQDNVSRNPRNMEEVERMGLTHMLKKNRMYAQYNYEEWRYPKKDRAIDISCTRHVFKDYVEDQPGFLRRPQERAIELKNDLLCHRVIKKRVPTFHRKRFPGEAQKIYVESHELLNTENWTLEKRDETEETLHGLVTEHAYSDMIKGLDLKTVFWKFVESIEPPRVVQVTATPMIHEKNEYGQVTVRFHTKQILTIHDRFGRLMLGSSDVPREVLEFVVFERHLADRYGKWRIHAKQLSGNTAREELEKTVAVMRRKPERSRADEWHRQEEDNDCLYKWYPAREYLIDLLEKRKKQDRGILWRRARRKWQVMNVKRTPMVRMRRRHKRLVAWKRGLVIDLRERGELPLPD